MPFNVVASCRKIGKKVRVYIGVETSFNKSAIECKETNLSVYFGFNGRRHFLGWISNRTSATLSNEIEIAPTEFSRLTENKYSPITLLINGKYNQRECFEDNRKNQSVNIGPNNNADFDCKIYWDNSSSWSECGFAGPHCYGTVTVTKSTGGTAECPAPCCTCCETIFDKPTKWIDQCPPSLNAYTTVPEYAAKSCQPNQNLEYSGPLWVDCQYFCEKTGRILDTSKQPTRGVLCEKGPGICWPCRPLTCKECTLGVQSFELLDITPLGLSNLKNKNIDNQFKDMVLHTLNIS